MHDRVIWPEKYGPKTSASHEISDVEIAFHNRSRA